MPDFPKVGGATAAEVAAAILVDPATDKIDGSKVDASIASRSTLTQAQVLSDATPFAGASVAAVKAKTDIIPADIGTQLDTNLPAVKAKTDIIGASVALETGGNVAAVKTKTDALPTDPADESLLEAAIATRASAADYTPARAAKMDKIQDFLEEGGGTLTADGTEQTVREYTGTGKLHVYIDTFNMTGTDSITIKQYMKVKSGGTYRLFAQETYTGSQTLALLHVVTRPGKYGVKITLTQAATPWRTYDWESFAEQAAA